jgi:hypothetical protein
MIDAARMWSIPKREWEGKNMNVYVVLENPDSDTTYIQGVYSTLDKAKYVVEELSNTQYNYSDYSIHECEVDDYEFPKV